MSSWLESGVLLAVLMPILGTIALWSWHLQRRTIALQEQEERFRQWVEDITERKQLAAELQQTRNFLQVVIDHLPVAVFVKDGRAEHFGEMLLWNQTSETMFGVTAEQAIGKTVHDYFPKEQADYFLQKDREAFERGTPEDIPEEPIDSHSLGRRILHTVKVPLYNAQQRPEYLLCFSEDITERKQAEVALQDREERLRLALEAVNMGAWEVNLQTGEEIWSSQSEAILGFAPNTFDGTLASFLNQIHPDDRAYVQQANQEALQTGYYRAEYRVVWPNQTIRWLSSRAQIFYDAAGTPIRMVGIDVDITERKCSEAERKLAENAVRESEHRLSILISNLPGYIYRVTNDPNYTPEFISEGVLAITGYRQEEYLSDRTISCGQEIFPEDAEPLWNIVQQAVATQQPYECEYRIMTKSGEQKWVWGRGRGVYADNGDLLYLEGFVTDITRRKQAEAALKQSEERYRQLSEDMPALICQFLPDSTLTYVNSTYSNYFNQDPDQLIGRRFLDFLPDEAERQSAQAQYMALTPDAPVISYEHRVIRADGSEGWQQWVNRAFFDEHSQIINLQSMGFDITTAKHDEAIRKQAESDLREQQTRLNLALEAASMGTWDGNLLTGEEIWSPQTEVLFGFAPGTFDGKAESFLNRIHPDDLVKVQQAVKTAMQTGCLQQEYRIVRPDRTTRWIHCLGKVFNDETGHPIRILGVDLDITERKTAELALQRLNDELELRIKHRTAALQASEARFRGFFDGAPIGIAVADVQRDRLTAVNQAFCQLLGYGEAELLTLESCFSLFVVDDWNAELPYVEALLSGEVPADPIEKRYTQKSGETIVGSLTTTLLRDQGGQVTHIIGMLQDITQRQHAEDQLRKSDAHLRTAQRIGKLGSWEFALQTRSLSWSEEVFHIYGREPALGAPTYEELQHAIHPEDWQYFDQTVQTAITAGQSYEMEHRLFRPDRTLVYVLARGEMNYDATGQITHIIGTVLDITDRKLTEQKIQQTALQLEATNRELESFSYSVSHDLRAPLRHIHGFINALEQRLHNHAALSDPKVTHYLQVIENSSQKMAQLIDGLLTLSRIGRKPMDYQPVRLRELVDEAIALVHNQPETMAPVEFAIGPLPTVQGDATLLQQVLSNLISNAVKFSRHQPTPCIEIGSLPEGAIFIKDNGVGFQMEYADKLFGAFQRLHAQNAFEGTGIGLTIVQRIIHRHGGTIWAESQPNQGAIFYFTVGNFS